MPWVLQDFCTTLHEAVKFLHKEINMNVRLLGSVVVAFNILWTNHIKSETRTPHKSDAFLSMSTWPFWHVCCSNLQGAAVGRNVLQPKVEWILFQYPQWTASCCILQRGMTIAISKWPFVGIWYSPFSDAPVCVYNIVYLCIDAQIVMTLYCLFAAAGRKYCNCQRRFFFQAFATRRGKMSWTNYLWDVISIYLAHGSCWCATEADGSVGQHSERWEPRWLLGGVDWVHWVDWVDWLDGPTS